MLTNEFSSGGNFTTVNEVDPDSGTIIEILPAYVEVELAVVEPAVLSKFQARLESGGLAAANAYLTNKAGQVHIFRQRVAIRPASTRIAPGS